MKNIILCSDGTGNSAYKARGTNVFKIYEAVDIHDSKTNSNIPVQIAFYDDGIGTSGNIFARVCGNLFGYGFKQNIIDLYTALVHVYEPGDNVSVNFVPSFKV